MKKAILLQLVCISVLLYGCATIKVAVTESTIPFTEASYKNESDAIIYVYRTLSLVGKLVEWPVILDGTTVALFRQNAYMVLHVPAGIHSIQIGDISPDLVGITIGVISIAQGTFKVEAQKSYYLRSKGFAVDLLTAAEALPELMYMKYDPGKSTMP